MNCQPDHEREHVQTSSTEPATVESVEVHAAAPGQLEDWTPEASPVVQSETACAPTPAVQSLPETPMFQQWYLPPPPRIPHFGHFALLMGFLLAGFFATGVMMAVAMRMHWWGLKSVPMALTDLDIRLALGSEVLAYAVMFGAGLIFFPLIWHKGFFAGIQWNGGTAVEKRKEILFTALLCFILAVVNSVWMSGPKNAPIEKIFHTPGAAWWLFGFGISLAPFFEEMIFRGFLLPAMCTAFDWLAERFAQADEKWLNGGGRPEWSGSVIAKVALIFASPVILLPAHRYLSIVVFVLVALGFIFALAVFLLVAGLTKSKTAPLPRTFESGDHPVWSMPALVAGSLAASIPFAGMHATQTGYSWGVFSLLVCISLIFCWVRLSTRSLAASTLVHSSYNFLLFSIMLLSTGGFRHMDKL